MLDEEEIEIKKVVSCAYYNSVLLKDGRAFTWGLNSDGQLGIGMAIGLDMYESEKYPI